LVDGAVSVTVGETSVSVSYAELSRGYDLDAMLDSAFAVARGSNPLADGIARLRALVHSTQVLPAATDASTAVDRVVEDLLARFAVAPVDATVRYDPAAGFVTTDGVDGATLDADALRAELLAIAVRPDAADVTLELTATPVAPTVGTREAMAAAIAARWMTAAPLTLEGEGVTLSLAADQLISLISFEPTAGGFGPAIDRAALGLLLEPFAARVAREPTNASFTFDASGVSGVVPGKDGQELDTAGSVQAIVDALNTRAGGSLVASAGLAVVAREPALTSAAAEAAAEKMARLSTWTTYYVPGEGNYWGANISIPAHDLDGLVLAPGEWFSFWDDIGPMTVERGYGYGGAIIGGRSVRNGALGGGVCSTSTTLFNAAMRSGLEIGERTNHSYYIERYPVGLDATVLKTDTYETDMTFRNDTDSPIVIRAYTGNGFVRFDIWGVPDGRTVSLSSPIVSNRGTARETTVVNTRLAPGTRLRVEYPHDGFHAVVTRTVRDADGTVLHQDTWASNYRTVNGITEVGPAPAATPQPSTPPPSPSPSASPAA
jgi:vancomycin resistance protein YoaR